MKNRETTKMYIYNQCPKEKFHPTPPQNGIQQIFKTSQKKKKTKTFLK